MAGTSGAHLLYILDEASGIPEAIFEAIAGNSAGSGTRVLLFSNPTKTTGEFFESHHDKALKFNADGTPQLDDNGRQVGFYKAITISSEDSPNVVLGYDKIPGLAGPEWVEEKRLEWGIDHPLYKVRVLGQFVLNEEGKILSIDTITQAEERWRGLQKIAGGWLVEPGPSDGRLHIGIDPAGPGQGGDESAFVVRRGKVIVEVYTRRGVSDGGHLAELLGLLAKHRHHREPSAVVKIDREGLGNGIYALLRAHLEMHTDAFELIGVRSSDKPVRKPETYDRLRDELFANLHEWFRDGGCIPEDARLAKELHVPSWISHTNGKLKATPKSEMRKALDGRSPDRADALSLSVWDLTQTAVEDLPPPEPEVDAGYSTSAYRSSSYNDRAFFGSGRGR